MRTTRPLVLKKTVVDGFTLIDLLAVIIICGILGALLLPALASTNSDSRALQCLDNQRQLVRAWLLYSADFNGKICLTGGSGQTATSLTDPNIHNGNWVHGMMNVAGEASTDPALVKAGALFPYTKSVDLYKCPADTTMRPNTNNILTPTTRSVSMNSWLNPIISFDQSYGHIFRKQTDIVTNANTWVTLDESPGSINDGWFVCDPWYSNYPSTTWVDIPASYHNRAGGISFADGHAQIRKWTDSSVIRYGRVGGPQANFVPQGTPAGDLRWLQNASTY